MVWPTSGISQQTRAAEAAWSSQLPALRERDRELLQVRRRMGVRPTASRAPPNTAPTPSAIPAPRNSVRRRRDLLARAPRCHLYLGARERIRQPGEPRDRDGGEVS